MVVKIRLARFGAKKRPFYRLVAANNDAPRNGRFLEKLGTYNPILKEDLAKKLSFNKERINYWISQGAQPTEKVAKFLELLKYDLPNYITKKIAVFKKGYKAKPSKKELKEQANKSN